MIILRKQKEYNIVTDLYYSGFPRTYRKVVGNARRNIAKKLSKSALNNYKINSELSSKIKSAKFIDNPELNNKLIDRAKSDGVILKSIKDINPKYVSMKDGSKIIFISSNTGNQEIAHELGHHEVLSGAQGKINQKVQQYYNDVSNPEFIKTRSLQDSYMNHGKSGIRNIWKDLRNRAVILKGENDATKQGLKILKESGANPEEIQKAKISLQNNLETYKNVTTGDLKTTLRNTIQIPSRKHTSIKNDIRDKRIIKKVTGVYPKFINPQ